VLREQVERMLRSPQAAAFTKNFCGQWLSLRDIDFTAPNYIAYPEYDEMLKVSMVRESELFFSELLEHDLSLTNIVASDFSMLNGGSRAITASRGSRACGSSGRWRCRRRAIAAA
jgi:hypothetical protein